MRQYLNYWNMITVVLATVIITAISPCGIWQRLGICFIISTVYFIGEWRGCKWTVKRTIEEIDKIKGERK